MRYLCVFLATALLGCGGSTAPQPVSAELSVYEGWPPEGGTSPVVIQLSPDEWESVRPHLPNLDAGERKRWKNSVHRLTLILKATDGLEIARGTFDDEDRLRIDYPNGESSFFQVDRSLHDQISAIASRGAQQ